MIVIFVVSVDRKSRNTVILHQVHLASVFFQLKFIFVFRTASNFLFKTVALSSLVV